MPPQYHRELLPVPVRDANFLDLEEIVKVHQIAFRGFFLDLMGPRFLRIYYRTILEYGRSIFLVHVDDAGKIDGFAAGFLDPQAFYAHFRSQRFRLLPIIISSLIRRPALLPQIVRNARRVSRSQPAFLEGSELASIATSRRGSGIGSILLRSFCARSASDGANKVILATDHTNNEAILRFYNAHGFEQRAVEERGTRTLQILVRDAQL